MIPVLIMLITVDVLLLPAGDLGGDFLSRRFPWPGYWAGNCRGVRAADRGDPLPVVSAWMR